KDLALGYLASGKLGTQIAQKLDGQPHVGLDQRPQGVVLAAGRNQLQRRDAQTLLENFTGVYRVGTGHMAANIDMVGGGGGKCNQCSISENGLQDEDVRQVHPAFERIVQDENVAILD